METQKRIILEYLLTGCRMTGLDALRIAGCIKASNRISELRADGFAIKYTWKEIKTKFGDKRVKEYYL